MTDPCTLAVVLFLGGAFAFVALAAFTRAVRAREYLDRTRVARVREYLDEHERYTGRWGGVQLDVRRRIALAGSIKQHPGWDVRWTEGDVVSEGTVPDDRLDAEIERWLRRGDVVRAGRAA